MSEEDTTLQDDEILTESSSTEIKSEVADTEGDSDGTDTGEGGGGSDADDSDSDSDDSDT